MTSTKTEAVVSYNPEPINNEVKRFYVPGLVVKMPCPSCGKDMTWDGEDQYLMYGALNTPEEIFLGCRDDECENEGGIKHRVTVNVKLAVSVEYLGTTVETRETK
jgi:hypothetical protein